MVGRRGKRLKEEREVSMQRRRKVSLFDLRCLDAPLGIRIHGTSRVFPASCKEARIVAIRASGARWLLSPQRIWNVRTVECDWPPPVPVIVM